MLNAIRSHQSHTLTEQQRPPGGIAPASPPASDASRVRYLYFLPSLFVLLAFLFPKKDPSSHPRFTESKRSFPTSPIPTVQTSLSAGLNERFSTDFGADFLFPRLILGLGDTDSTIVYYHVTNGISAPSAELLAELQAEPQEIVTER